MRRCPTCWAENDDDAIQCSNCGDFFPPEEADEPIEPHPAGFETEQKNLGIAGVLSFLIPGLGLIYRERLIAGLVWFVVVSVGYFFFIVPGIILHVICLFVSMRPNKNHFAARTNRSIQR